jgi:pimeloyl-ACP methyl ester carboxylesterase
MPSLRLVILAASTVLGFGDSAAPKAVAAAGTAGTHVGEVRGHVAQVDGIGVFYREAGPTDAPTIVLLHGNPSSSFMFRDLIPHLAGRFHVIAPDYPGFGYSDAPSPETYAYTFHHLAQTTDHLLTQLGSKRYVLYLQDYGGPVGFRLAAAHPERVAGLILQNANAYVEGLSPEWRAALEGQIKAAAQHPEPKPIQHKPPSPFAENLKWVRKMYLAGAHDPASMTPDSYTLDAALLSRPGQDDIQDALDNDYYTNVLAYPDWQAWLRRAQPRTLLVWGRDDKIFGPPAAEAYRRDLPGAKLVFYDGGHFVLEEHASEVADEIIGMFGGDAGRR